MRQMNREEFLDLVDKWNAEARALLESKGHDYAGEDVHANFKRMFKVCAIYDIHPGKRLEDVYLFLVILKLDRMIHNLHQAERPNHESIKDTTLDHQNYVHLLTSFMQLLEHSSEGESYACLDI